MAGWAIRREWAIARLRLRGVRGRRIQRLHRLPPPGPRRTLRGIARAFAFGGAVAELASGSSPDRVIDAILTAARGVAISEPRMQVGTDGSVLMRTHTPVGPVVLRIAPPNDHGRLDSAADALQRLADMDVQLVPRLVDRGEIAGASWTTETVASGMTPSRLSSDLRVDVADFAVHLAVRDQPITAPGEDLAALARIVPGASVQLARVGAALEERLADLPAVVQHGDLLIGNLLTTKGRLTGVVDWETWHPAGTPGVDLLQLTAFDDLGLKGQLGRIWRARPWQSVAYRAITRPYFEALGVEADARQLHSIAIAWWANRIKVLRRRPERRRLFHDPAWLEANVAVVLRMISEELDVATPTVRA